MNQVQASPLGTPGILTMNEPVMVSILMTQQPVANSSWISGFASAFEAGLLASVITPGTVTNPAWIGSGSLDILTLPSGAATIVTIPAAKAALTASLQMVTSSNSPPMPLAQAIHDATLLLQFTCIGLGPPPVFPPIPIVLSAL